MRTTVEFDDDTGAVVDRVRREEGVGVSEAVNRLIRRSLLVQDEPARFRQRTRPLGLRIDVSNIGEALDALDGPAAR
jgi:hypothetical protein